MPCSKPRISADTPRTQGPCSLRKPCRGLCHHLLGPTARREWGPRRQHGGTQGLIPPHLEPPRTHSCYPVPGEGGATPHPPSQDRQRQSSWLLPWQLRRAGSASPGSTAKDLFKSQHQLGFRLTWAMRARGHLPSLSFVSLCAQWSCSPCTASKFQV